MQEEISRVEATATLKRRPRSSKPHPNGSDFTLQESSTVKRRPKSRDKEPEGFADMAAANGEPVGPNTTQPVPYQNGTATMKRRPVSDAGVTEQPQPQPQPQPQHQPQPQPQPQVTAAPRRDSMDQGAPVGNEGGPVRKPKPPVSPKPVVAQIKRQAGPPTPPQSVCNKRVPLPGPGTPGSPGTDRIWFCSSKINILCLRLSYAGRRKELYKLSVTESQTSPSICMSERCGRGGFRHCLTGTLCEAD